MTRATARASGTVAAVIEHVSRRTALDFAGCHRERMIESVLAHWQEVGVDDLQDYCELLDRVPAAFDDLVNRLTVGETYFFREQAHLDHLRLLVRSHLEGSTSKRQLRIWSAGCATGEETYTLAMIVADEGGLDTTRILGTDLSEWKLARAREATYGEWSLRRCGERERSLYFERDGASFRVRPRYAEAVDFRALNLTAGPPEVGTFDVVICRNVLMYLTPHGVARATRSMREALVDGGWALIGSGDPLLELDGLERVMTDHGIAYRRVGVPRVTSMSQPTVRSLSPARPGPEPGPVRGPRRPPPGPPPVEVPAPPPTADVVRALGASGAVDEAERAIEAAIAARPLEPELRYLCAVLHLRAGRATDAAAAAAAALYLEPRLAVAHLALGRAELMAGRRERARRCFRNAHELLASMPPDAEVPLAEGERAGPLAVTAAGLADGVR